MKWVVWYLVISLACTLAMGTWLMVGWVRREREKERLLGAPANAPHRWPGIAPKLAMAVLKAIALAPVWPLVLVYVYRKSLVEAAEPLPEDIPFAVLPAHLVAPMTTEEIEAREHVQDPLGAVPPVPFGHIHPAWTAFTTSVDQAATLWSFACTWTDVWGRSEYREGYVAVIDGQPGRFFCTVVREVEKD